MRMYYNCSFYYFLSDKLFLKQSSDFFLTETEIGLRTVTETADTAFLMYVANDL